MTALNMRWSDEKHRRLKALAKSRDTRLNRMIDDLTSPQSNSCSFDLYRRQ